MFLKYSFRTVGTVTCPQLCPSNLTIENYVCWRPSLLLTCNIYVVKSARLLSSHPRLLSSFLLRFTSLEVQPATTSKTWCDSGWAFLSLTAKTVGFLSKRVFFRSKSATLIPTLFFDHFRVLGLYKNMICFAVYFFSAFLKKTVKGSSHRELKNGHLLWVHDLGIVISSDKNKTPYFCRSIHKSPLSCRHAQETLMIAD